MLSELPENISTFGGDIDNVLAIIWWITIAWLVAAEAVLNFLPEERRKKVRNCIVFYYFVVL